MSERKSRASLSRVRRSAVEIARDAWVKLRSKNVALRFTLTLIQVLALLWPVFVHGLKSGLVPLAVFALAWWIKAWRDGRSHLPFVERNHAARSTLHYRLVKEMQRTSELNDSEVDAFQQNVLLYIATAVRDYHLDGKHPTIFANLLVEDGENLMVIARDREHRQTAARYPKATMLAWKAMAGGKHERTDDLTRDFPECTGKDYRSILVIPIYSRAKVVGAVSIDSSKEYHFARSANEIVDYLAPFVCMLGWTIDRRSTKLRVGDASGSTEENNDSHVEHRDLRASSSSKNEPG